MLNINDWNWPDPEPEAQLGDIALASKRAMALLVRNRQRGMLQTHLMQIVGAIEIIAGMEYHHDAFTRLHRRMARTGAADDLHLRHEAIAYLNRLGQFVTFGRSSVAVMTDLVSDRDLPIMEKAMVFRNKHAAHRSIDAPRGGETPALVHSHARSLSTTFGSLFHPRPGKRPLNMHRLPTPVTLETLRKAIWRAGFLVFQLQTNVAGAHLEFSLEEEHPAIMNEAFWAIERVIMASDSA